LSNVSFVNAVLYFLNSQTDVVNFSDKMKMVDYNGRCAINGST